MSSIERIRKPRQLTENTGVTATGSGDKDNATNLLKFYANNTLTHNTNTLFIRLPRPKFQGEFLKITLNPGGTNTHLICQLAGTSSDQLTINGGAVQNINGTAHNGADLDLDANNEYFAYATSKTNWNVYKKDPQAS